MSKDTINAILYLCDERIVTTANDASVTFFDLLRPGGSLYVLIVLVFLLLLSVLSFRFWRKVQRMASYGLLLVLTAIVFVFGVVIYTVGALQSDIMGLWDAVYTIPSAIISSLGMFVYQDDISELSDRAKNCSEFMAAYSLAHLLAAIITSLIMIKWLGMLLYYKYKLYTFSKQSTDLYVFWGINPASLTLAQSIHENCPDEEIVFVNDMDEEDNSGVNIHRLLDIIQLKNDIDEKIAAMGATVANCHVDIADSSVCKVKNIELFFRNVARLRLLSKIIRQAANFHLFFLSADEDKNIIAMGNLVTILEKEEKTAPTNRRTFLYCHARKSASTNVFDNKNLLNYDMDQRLNVIDSAQLSVLCLKRNVADCPVSFVDIDKDNGTVSSTFRSMIIGFGETGEEVFNFLYEFGAFVNDKGRKTPFRCTVIDKQADALYENLVSKAPALKATQCEGVDTLNFVNTEMGGVDFWPTVEKEIADGLNYLVIAINEDKVCINTAMEICSRALQWRKPDAKVLNVYVRCYNQQNYRQMVRIAQDMQKSYERITLKVFGGLEDIFNYETIVKKQYLQEAKMYNWEYCKLDKDYKGDKSDIEECWQNGLKIQRTKGKNTIWNIDDSFRMLAQNISNALHKETKMYLLSRAGYDTTYWKSKDLERCPACNTYPHLNYNENRILHNIARLEHERWVASMILQKWQPTPNSTDEKNVVRKLHNDMRPWDELRSEGQARITTQGYDCAVVETSIRLKIRE